MSSYEHYVAALLIALAQDAAAESAACMSDMQCKGEQICVRATCSIPQVSEMMPAGSSGRVTRFISSRYVVKTTRADCVKRGGEHEAGEATEVTRCMLPSSAKKPADAEGAGR